MLESEGMRHVPRPPRRPFRPIEQLWNVDNEGHETIAAAVFSGIDGWTVIRTAPSILLAKPPSSGERLRFEQLCKTIRAAGFLLVSDSASGSILAESDGENRYTLSGFVTEHFELYEQLFIPQPTRLRFQILPLQRILDQMTYEYDHFLSVGDENCARVLAEMLGGWQVAGELARVLGGKNVSYCNGPKTDHMLASYEAFDAEGGQELYSQSPNPIE